MFNILQTDDKGISSNYRGFSLLCWLRESRGCLDLCFTALSAHVLVVIPERLSGWSAARISRQNICQLVDRGFGDLESWNPKPNP